MKNLLLILLYVVPVIASAQEYQTKDSVYIRLKKTKDVRDKGNVRSAMKVKSSEINKILVRCQIKTMNNQDIDVNVFSLVDHKNKLRYRMIDYLGYKGFSIMGSGGRPASKMLKTQLLTKKGNDWTSVPYDPSVPDTFEAYNLEGYQTVEFPVNFGTTKREKLSVIYYTPTEMNQFTGEFFFAIFEKAEADTFDFYYKNEKVFEIAVN